MALSVLMVATAFAGCGKTGGTDKAETTAATTAAKEETTAAAADPASIKGEITVLTNRTDVVDTQFAGPGGYAEQFNKKYPNVKVKYEAITNYEDDVKTRMSTTEYGDVLLIPGGVEPKDYPTFFEPLGKADDLKKTYRYIDTKGSFEGTTYGIATIGNAQGIIYNKKIFADAGITTLPKTSDEFIADLKKIKDKNGDKVIPLYTNYAAGWPLNQWADRLGAVAASPDYVNKLAHEKDPFAKDKPLYTIYKTMYDAVSQGLCEKDPMTSDWESSKKMVGTGEIATMVLGSWSIKQIQEAAGANAANIGYMPHPTSTDGKVYVSAGPDYTMAVNKNSKSKEAALAYLHWFIDESKYYDYCQCISPKIADPMPEALKAFDEMKVEYVINNAAPAGEDGLTDNIAKAAEIGLSDDPWKKIIIEKALSKESFDDYMAELNKRWDSAMADATK